MRYEKPEYARRGDEHTRSHGGSTYHNCKVINIVNTSPYSKDLKDLLETATSDSPPPKKQFPGSVKANSFSDPEVNEVIKTINIGKIEREYYQKKLSPQGILVLRACEIRTKNELTERA